MRIGLSTAAFYGRWETEEAAAQLAQYGADCAEVFLQTHSEYTAAFGKIARRALGGLPCTSVHPMGTHFENGLFAKSARQRQDTLDLYRRALDAAAELGANCYVYHGRHTPVLTALPFDLAANVDAVGTMCIEAAQRGMTLAWENVCWCQLTTPQRVEQIRGALPQARFTLDIKQAMRAGCDARAFVRAMGDALVNVHVCDWDASGALCLPGEGGFDFAAFFAALRENRYGGPVIVEPYLGLIKSDAALQNSLAFLRELAELPADEMG